jgi:HEPN domain-containing protein
MSEEDRYRAAAIERRRDAANLKEGGRDLAAIYVLGYAVECALKALLQREGKKFRSSGREGHNLLGLWEQAGFRRRDISGYRRRFLDEWSTSLRYLDVFPKDLDVVALYEGGRELAGYVEIQSRRSKRKRDRR